MDLQNGRPLKPHKCPFLKPESLPERLQGKDWTTYSGAHHTDHSVRGEFFDQHPAPDRDRGDYLLDFMYIGGATEGENAELTNGVPVSKEAVFADIGTPETWRRRKPAKCAAVSRPREAEVQIQNALSVCKEWFDEASK